MYFELFSMRFPDIAEEETRSLTLLNVAGIPRGTYTFVESYCAEPGCDCRRVFFSVVDWSIREIKAVISYGWEDVAFYTQWLGRNDPDVLRDLKGPALNPLSKQSELAPALLEQMPLLLSDPAYVARIKRHYKMFKEAVNREAGLRVKPGHKSSPTMRRMKKRKPL